MGDGILIDRKGRVWSELSWQLAQQIGAGDGCEDLATVAVREHGFVHVQARTRENGVQVAVREGRFNLTAFAGLMIELGRMKPTRIVLTVVTAGAPRFYFFADLHDLCGHLEPLAHGKPIEVRVPRLSERRNRRVLTLPTFACARPIVDLWEKSRGRLSDEVYDALAAGGLSRRTILARQVPRTSRLVFWHIGTAIKLMRPCESLLAIGRDLHDQPDRQYGEWVEETYDQTLRDGGLRIDSCRASIQTSAATTLRVRYDRVLLPWRTTEDRFVMCLSIQRELTVVAS
jgi:hypothetical protein